MASSTLKLDWSKSPSIKSLNSSLHGIIILSRMNLSWNAKTSLFLLAWRCIIHKRYLSCWLFSFSLTLISNSNFIIFFNSLKSSFLLTLFISLKVSKILNPIIFLWKLDLISDNSNFNFELLAYSIAFSNFSFSSNESLK